MAEEEILNLLQINGQHHIINHYWKLNKEKRKAFLANLQELNLSLGFELYKKFSQQEISPPRRQINPAPIITQEILQNDHLRVRKARAIGEDLLRRRKVAVLIVAGGQGTRLGFEGPKGIFPITPVKKKSLFQLFCETVKALSLKYGIQIPLLIMTSQENHDQTVNYFREHNFFGLRAENVHFFQQGLLPTFTPEGCLLLKEETNLLANPDGHGGSLKALYESSLLDYLKNHGFTELFYCQVDNPLVKIADPLFLGVHKMEEAEISTKVVRRRDLKEKVGIYGLLNGQPAIIEYSDFLPADYEALDEKGHMRYWAGNTAIHVISLSFIERLNQRGFALPYHRAIKDVYGCGPEGKLIQRPGWKFETFVFDALPLAQKCCALEVRREEEFAPVKNKEGADSPATARAALNSLYRHWLVEAGAEIAPEIQVEISPLFALDKEDLLVRLKGMKLILKEDTYLA
ncbi:MAG: UTP--glucose-1-phosphate uridylyltransferase [Thermodesulfobacteriota bacterium]